MSICRRLFSMTTPVPKNFLVKSVVLVAQGLIRSYEDVGVATMSFKKY